MIQPTPQPVPWGTAHIHRGAHWHDHAMAFVQQFPPPQLLTVEAFDAFAASRGIYVRPKSASKGTVTWQFLLGRRALLKKNLNKAGAHPRMFLSGLSPFYLSVVQIGRTWEVREPHEAYKDKRLLEHLQQAFEPVQRNIEYLLQSVQWEHLPPYEPRFAEMYFQRLVSSKMKLHQEIGEVMTEFAKLEANLRVALPKSQVGA